jgi:hypothetical protein
MPSFDTRLRYGSLKGTYTFKIFCINSSCEPPLNGGLKASIMNRIIPADHKSHFYV